MREPTEATDHVEMSVEEALGRSRATISGILLRAPSGDGGCAFEHVRKTYNPIGHGNAECGVRSQRVAQPSAHCYFHVHALAV